MAAETTLTSTKAWAPDITTYQAGDVIPDALVLQTSTVSGSIEGDAPSVRVPFVTDATAGFVAEGDAIPEADPALAEVTVYTGKVSQLVKLSREQFVQPNAAGLLSASVQRAVIKAADIAYLAQAAPVSPATTPPAGLSKITGVVVPPGAPAAKVTGSLDVLVDLLATLEGNGAQPTHIILSPTAWATLRKMKTATGSNASLIGAGTQDAQHMLLDVPVLVSPAMTTNFGMILDRSAIASAVSPVTVAQSEHYYFNADNIALRCTFRFGANLVHPDRVGLFEVA